MKLRTKLAMIVCVPALLAGCRQTDAGNTRIESEESRTDAGNTRTDPGNTRTDAGNTRTDPGNTRTGDETK